MHTGLAEGDLFLESLSWHCFAVVTEELVSGQEDLKDFR